MGKSKKINPNDLILENIGCLTIVEYLGEYIKDGTKLKSHYYKCKCNNCGKDTIVNRGNLLRAKKNDINIGCGCLMREAISKSNKTHGMTKSRIYQTFTDIKRRCYNSNTKAYKNYGGRGIIVCDEWLIKEGMGFMNFYNWAMENGYTDKLTIDRNNVNGNYEPNNCSWITMKEQENNRRNNKVIAINGIEKNESKWAEEFNISVQLLRYRIKKGLKDDDLIKTPRKKKVN